MQYISAIYCFSSPISYQIAILQDSLGYHRSNWSLHYNWPFQRPNCCSNWLPQYYCIALDGVFNLQTMWFWSHLMLLPTVRQSYFQINIELLASRKWKPEKWHKRLYAQAIVDTKEKNVQSQTLLDLAGYGFPNLDLKSKMLCFQYFIWRILIVNLNIHVHVFNKMLFSKWSNIPSDVFFPRSSGPPH